MLPDSCLYQMPLKTASGALMTGGASLLNHKKYGVPITIKTYIFDLLNMSDVSPLRQKAFRDREK